MTATTKGPTVEAEPFSTRCANTSQHIPALFKSQDTTTMPYEFMPVDGQRVRYARKIVESDGETVRLGQIGTVIAVRDNTPADDVFGPVTVHVVMDGEHGIVPAAVFRHEELEPVRTDDTVPASEVEIVKHLTGTDPTVEPDPTGGEYVCPVEGCDFVVGAVGPVDPDEPDPFMEEVSAHRRSHERDEVRGTVGEVPAVPIWEALREVGSVYDAIVGLRELPAADVSRALRIVADVLDGGAK